MTITVSKQEFCARVEELLALAQGGAEVVIQNDSQGALRMTAVPVPPREVIFDMHPGAMVMREDFDDPIDEEAFLRGEY